MTSNDSKYLDSKSQNKLTEHNGSCQGPEVSRSLYPHGHHHLHLHGSHHVSGRIGFAFYLNLIFAVIELIGGFYVNSMAILTDALHDFGDALALGLSWYLEKKSKLKSDLKFSYGYRRLSTLSAFITALVLVSGSLFIIVETLPRLWNPIQPQVDGMLALAVLGIVVNGAAVFKMKKGTSLNEKVLTWHFIEDVFGWILVLVGAIVMKFSHFPQIDALLALMLSTWVLWNVFKNLKEAVSIFLQGTPSHLSLIEIRHKIKELSEVQDVHHLHLWSLDGDHHILTAHIVLRSVCNLDKVSHIKQDIKRLLSERFNIQEVTLEFEFPDEYCSDPNHITI